MSKSVIDENFVKEDFVTETTPERHSINTLNTLQSTISLKRAAFKPSNNRYSEETVASYGNRKFMPFSMRWINGYNTKVPVINLNLDGSTLLFYAAANCGVVYNWTTNQQTLLQGHKHVVNTIAADCTGKWLVTAAAGEENVIIIWDSFGFIPVRTIFQPHGETKVAKVAMSGDAKYLLSVGYRDNTRLYWWIWSFGVGVPHAELDIDLPPKSIIQVEFNPVDSKQFVLLSPTDLVIVTSGKLFIKDHGILKETDRYILRSHCPEKDKSIEETGRYVCCTFVENTSQVLVGTTKGNVIVFGYFLDYKNHTEPTIIDNFKFIKSVKVDCHIINTINSVDGYIVTGNQAGDINFYDEQLKMLYWLHGFKVQCVKGISFNKTPRSFVILDPKCGKHYCWEHVEVEEDSETGLPKQKLMKKKIDYDATAPMKPFVVRDFVITTDDEGIIYTEFYTEKPTIIVNCRKGHITTTTVHPEKSLICMGYAGGNVELFDCKQHRLLARLELNAHYAQLVPPDDMSVHSACQLITPSLPVSCLKYSPSGMHLACGLSNGELLFLHPVTIVIETEKRLCNTTFAITQINFSPDSLTIATADQGETVCVYEYNCKESSWSFIGKHRAHYKPITRVFFTTGKRGGYYRLFSIGIDRMLVEYDIGASSNECLVLVSMDRIEQVGVPLSGIEFPTPKIISFSQTFPVVFDPDVHRSDLHLILIATDEHKYKLINCDTAMTLCTTLGPRFDCPVLRMLLVSTRDNLNQKLEYVVFCTDTLIGIQKMPLDGNPWSYVAMLGHPTKILKMCYREDLSAMFTIGAKDNCLIQWDANYSSVEDQHSKGGTELDPYYVLVEHGRPGWLFQEIRDLFYYIQILCQGTFTPEMRTVKEYIPIASLPDLVRALGYFPTQYEVENLLVEARYKVYRKEPADEIDFFEFVKLFLNHRPAFGDNYSKIIAAFQKFAQLRKERFVIDSEEFVNTLGSHGEAFPRDLSCYLLSILCGLSFEDRQTMEDEDFSFLPYEISLNDFINNIMGIQEVDQGDLCSEGAFSMGSQSHISDISFFAD